jgi:hypothetical protein
VCSGRFCGGGELHDRTAQLRAVRGAQKMEVRANATAVQSAIRVF